jgi:hypothetical protein
MIAAAFVAQLQSAKVAEPTQRALDNVTRSPQPTSMNRLSRERLQQRLNTQCLHLLDQRRASISRVTLESLGLAAGPATWTWNAGHGGHERHCHPTVMRAGGCRPDNQGQALGICQHMAFAPVFRTVGWVRSGVRPPKTARSRCPGQHARDLQLLLCLASSATRHAALAKRPAWSSGQNDANRCCRCRSPFR